MSKTTRTPIWSWHYFVGCIPHFVPVELEKLLLADLTKRHRKLATVVYSYPATQWAIDLGGIELRRPKEQLRWSGLIVHLWSDEVCIIIERLAKTKLRQFQDGTEYYKFKLADRCCVMTLVQAEQLRVVLHDFANTARARDADYRDALGQGLTHDVDE